MSKECSACGAVLQDDYWLGRHMSKHEGPLVDLETGEGRLIKGYHLSMLLGLTAAIVGVAVTLLTYNAAGPGELYFLWYGPAIFGALAFLRGFIECLFRAPRTGFLVAVVVALGAISSVLGTDVDSTLIGAIKQE